MILLRTFIGETVWAAANLFRGLWLLVKNPTRFIKFSEEYSRFEKQIDEMDSVRASGYFDMSREQRRAAKKKFRGIERQLGAPK